MTQDIRYFAHYWRQSTARSEQRNFPGARIRHAGGELFRKRDVQPGHKIYAWTIIEKKLHLIGSYYVDRYATQEEANALYEPDGFDAWQATDHIIAVEATATTMQFDRIVPFSVIDELEFLSPSGERKEPKVTAGGVLDQQTLRGVRELTRESARLLDGLIES